MITVQNSKKHFKASWPTRYQTKQRPTIVQDDFFLGAPYCTLLKINLSKPVIVDEKTICNVSKIWN